ncbi:MAG: DUF1631 family protein, partial [Rhodanobacter sp.]
MPMQPGQDPPKSVFQGDPDHFQAPRWPARAQQLLDAILRMCRDHLRQPLQACLSQFEQQLFTSADRARNSLEQQKLLTSREQVLRHEAALEARYFAEIKRRIEQIDSTPVAVVRALGNTWHELALVDPGEQELASTLDQIGARGESLHSGVLRDLSYRVAVLVAAPPLEGDGLPISPQSLVQAFQCASLPVQLPVSEQVQLLRSFERNVIRMLTPLYEAVDSALASDGILPQLHNARPLRHPTGRAP